MKNNKSSLLIKALFYQDVWRHNNVVSSGVQEDEKRCVMIAGLFSVISKKGLTQRLLRMAAVTKRFASGQYDQRLEVVAADEIGQIEAHLNQVAEQFVELLAREKLLVEQNARLKERVHLSQDLHDSVKQHVLALAVQIELARSLFDQDRVAAREHLNEADELSYQVQQELSALIDAQRLRNCKRKGWRQRYATI
jgi:signal transduction histidine kinase